MDTLRMLQKVDAFHGLDEEELGSIAELCELRVYRAGEVMFTENSKGEEMFIVAKGRVGIELRIKGKSDQVTVHRVGEGQVFGELAIVDGGRRSATAECETDCEIVALGRATLRDIFERAPRIGYVVAMNMATTLAARLRKTNLQLIAVYLWE